MTPLAPAITSVVAADGVVKRFGATTALAGVSFAVPPGITGLLGANGAGKTTVLSLLLGLRRADAGHLSVLGLDPATDGAGVRAVVGYSPEHRALPDDVRANDFVSHLAAVHGLPRREATARASDALWLVGLGEERFRPVGSLSTGQKQRVKLAAAIAHDPHLLLLDEPTDGLDPMQREEMLGLIRRIGSEFGISVVLSSHMLDEVERICDGAVILGEGRVLAAGPLSTLQAGVGGWIVEIDGDAEVLAAALRTAGAVVTTDHRHLLVDGLTNALPIRDAVATLGLPLVRLQRRRLSLEDVFLAAGMFGEDV